MADAPPNPIGKLSPRQLTLIAAGGVGLGLLWRSRSKNATAGQVPDTVSALDDYNNVGFDTVGNIGTPTGTDRREVSNNGINLPTLGWVVDVGGNKFWTDGTNLSPLEPTVTAPNPTLEKPDWSKGSSTLNNDVWDYFGPVKDASGKTIHVYVNRRTGERMDRTTKM